MDKEYCNICNEFIDCETLVESKKRTLKGIDITYNQKINRCKNCNNKFFNEAVLNYNVESFNSSFKESIIKYLSKKYNVEISITNKVLFSVLSNAEIINDNIIKNCDKKIELFSSNSKIFVVSNYIINNSNDITPLTLQKLLYFVQGFSICFNNKFIFYDNCEAWVNGPVFRNIYDCYSNYKYNVIDKNVLDNEFLKLSNDELLLINKVIECFSKYNSLVLKEMSHSTFPWIKNRKYFSKKEKSSKIIKKNDIKIYFFQLLEDYKIKSLDDLSYYSENLFNQVINKKL